MIWILFPDDSKAVYNSLRGVCPAQIITLSTSKQVSDDIDHLKDRIIKELEWDAPIFEISAINGEGCDNLSKKIMEYIDSI